MAFVVTFRPLTYISPTRGLFSVTDLETSEFSDGRLRPSVARLWLKYYPTYRLDAFEHFVASIARPEMKVLEIGAGSGSGLQNAFSIKGRCARYVGIDLDPRVLNNPNLDEAYVANAVSLPFADGEFDLVFHKMVAEHLEDSRAALAEATRVLKPNGQLMFETPNRFYYAMLIAKLTPTRFHRFFVSRYGSGRSEEEVFPTHYRLNDRRTIKLLCREVGLEAQVTLQSIPPGYLRFSTVTFLIGVLYERTVERLFPALRARILVVARKRAA